MSFELDSPQFRNVELIIRTTTSPQTFTLPMKSAGIYDAKVHWGDGKVSTITAYNDSDLVHNYVTAGTYKIQIKGEIGGIYFNNVGGKSLVQSVNHRLKSPTTIDSAFHGCNNLASFRGDTKGMTNFLETWRNCSSLTSFPLINTSSGTNFSSAWRDCSSLTSFPLIDTSSGTNFLDTWRECSSLTSFPLIDTSSGTNFLNTWLNCSSLTSFPLIDTSSGINFNEAWRSCSSLTSFPLIDTSSGTDFSSAWRSCSSLTSFPANFFDNWVATPAFNCFLNTWDACSALTAQSVKNILVSIDTSGRNAPAGATGTQADITIDYNVATGGLTPATTTAITNLKTKRWKPRINGVYV